MARDVAAAVPHALHHAGKVHDRGVERNPQQARPVDLSNDARRANQRFRGNAAGVEAVAAQEMTLDERDFGAQTGGANGGDQSRGAAADDQQVQRVQRVHAAAHPRPLPCRVDP